MLVAGHEIEIVNPNDLTLGELRRTNRFLRSLHAQGEVDGADLESLDKIDKAVAMIMMSLADQVDGCGIDQATWDMAQSVTVAELTALAGGIDQGAAAAPEPTGRVVELTGELTADATAILSPTSADS